MKTKKRTFVKVPIVDLQKKYEGRAFNMKIDNNGNEPVRVRLFGDGSVFVQAVGSQGGDTPTPGPGGQGLTPEQRAAIVSLFRMATYTGDNAEGYIEILESHATLTGIDAVFTQGAAVIYPTASLDDLKQYLVVTAQYDDGTTMNVTDYTLSGTLTAGISTITAAYEGFTDDFTVIVTAVPTVTSIDAVYTQGNVIVYDGDILSKLKCSLVVTANYSDGTTQVVDDYTLSGTLATGTSTITATYQGFSDTFNVEVSALHAMYSVDGSTFRYCVPTHDPPYWQYREDRFRWSYVDFNLLAEGGKNYRFAITFTNTENTPVKLGVQAFSQVVLNAVANNNSWVWSQDQWDSGWKYLGTGSLDPSTLYVDVAIPEKALDMSPIVGVRFTVSYDPESSQVREGLSIKNISVIDLSTTPSLIGIDATFNQGGATIYDNASLDSLRQYLTVTAQYTGGGTQVVNDYTLSGTLAAGTSTITATYQGFSDTFTVNVTAQSVMTGIEAVFNQDGATIYSYASLDFLRQYLTVTAQYTGGYSHVVTDYVLSGVLSEGISVVTVTYQGFSDTFNVNITQSDLLYSVNGNMFEPVEPSNEYPYYRENSTKYRMFYKDFDLFLDGGHTYRFVFTCNKEYRAALNFGAQFYSQIVLDRVSENQTWNWNLDQYDSLWKNIAGSDKTGLLIDIYGDVEVPLQMNGSDIKGVRITIQYGDNSPNIQNPDYFSLQLLKIVKMS